MFATVSVSQVRKGQTIFWSMKNWIVVKAEPNMFGQIDIYLRTLRADGSVEAGHMTFDKNELNHQLVLSD